MMPTRTALDPSATPPVRRWGILAFAGFIQLTLSLSNTVVNIALPAAQDQMQFSDSSRQWVITAYALAFGSLLLLGGRLSDVVGRRRTLLIGLVGFAVASAAGGAAVNFAMLVSARAAQGLFAALLAPAALSLLTTTFPQGRDRVRAFGVFGALAVSGSTVGLLVGGVLTQFVSWRWSLYGNVVLALAALVGVVLVVPAERALERRRLDLLGATTAAAGLFSLVLGLSNAESAGWSSPLVWGLVAAGAVLLVGFVLVQQRVADPLLPLRIVLDRTRSGAYLSLWTLGVGLFGITLFLTYYLQENLGFPPAVAGAAFLPLVGAIILTSTMMPSSLSNRFGPRPLMFVGTLTAAGGLWWLSLLPATGNYFAHVVPQMLLVGLGLGAAMSTAINAATLGVDAADAGVASAMTNTMQQIGGSVGTAFLFTVASAQTTVSLADRATTDSATAAGYGAAFAVAAVIFAVGAVVAAAVMPGRNRVPVERLGNVQPARRVRTPG